MKKHCSNFWLGISISTQNANITVQKSHPLIVQIGADFSELSHRETNTSADYSVCAKQISRLSVSNNINNSGLRVYYLCLSALSVVWQTRRKLNCTNCLTDILKCIRNQPWYHFSSSTERWNSPSPSLICRKWWMQNRLFFLFESTMRSRSSSVESIFPVHAVIFFFYICFPVILWLANSFVICYTFGV